MNNAVYINPVINTDFPDPSIFRASDGWYYAYGTKHDKSITSSNVQAARSRDLIRWEMLPDVMPSKPVWAKNTLDFWAPQVIESKGTFYLYFSTSPDSNMGMAIGVATSQSPTGPFIDSGQALVSAPGFAAIDPHAFNDPISGKHYLYWGSGHEPIKVRELAPDWIHFAPDSHAIEVIATCDQTPGEKLIEGAYVIYRNGFYYLFYSGDNCWQSSTYAVMVARSKSPTGPFEKMAQVENKPNSIILQYSNTWHAPGQNSVISDASGQDWLFYHAVDSKNPYLPGTNTHRRPMLMDPITYENGWPQVRGNTPSNTPQKAPSVS
jgi:arabinan endo-1,5-alpha-L-arabinosidase